MAAYGRLIFLPSRNLLAARTCSMNRCQNASRQTLKTIREDIFPLRPRRPETPFLLYVKHVRPKINAQTPGIKPMEVIKKASSEWAELDPNEKEHYKKEYNEKYATYMKELQDYNDSITDDQRQLWNEKKKKFEESNVLAENKRKGEAFGKPKKPLPAFLLYAMSKKSERNPSIPFLSWLKTIRDIWVNLPEAEKEPFTVQAVQAMEQYKKDLTEWETKMIRLGHLDLVRRKTLTQCKAVKSEQSE